MSRYHDFQMDQSCSVSTVLQLCFQFVHFDVDVLHFSNLRFDVSRERGYMYDPCSSRIAFILPSPSPTFVLWYSVVVLFHVQSDKE